MSKKFVDNSNPEEEEKEESILINPRKLRESRKEIKTENDEIKFRKKGNTVEINFESEGRFSAPESMWFEDYNVEHVQQIATIEMDDMLETTAAILEELKNKDCNCSIGDLTSSEFLECLIGIKYKFESPMIKHYWMCKCQNDKMEEEQKLNEVMIDISTLKYRSIKEADEKFKLMFKDDFANITDAEFKEYLKDKYAKQPMENYDVWTREQELEVIQVKEPIYYRSKNNGNLYGFELMRIKHVVTAQREVNKMYRPKIKAIVNRPNTYNVPLPEFKSEKEEEIKKIDRMKAKDILLYSQAYTLISINGQTGLNNGEKVKKYSELKREEYFDLGNYLNDIEYGIHDEREFKCPLCGTVERRLLQREINPIELLPLNPDTQKQTKQEGNRRPTIYFGV